ncbi:MAG: hypothetical protein KAU22_12485 [Desulfuromonadales bacterium]|nr:hypothetical protein [Desulfuromonadales bacterium]
MANAKDFVDRVSQINGIAGCVLIRKDGTQIAQTLANPKKYSALMQTSNVLSVDIMESMGFGYCCYVSFAQENMDEFYVFSIDNYLLGVVKMSECSLATMLDMVYQLIGRVSTGNTEGVS